MALAHYWVQQFGRSHVGSELEILKDIWETETFWTFTEFQFREFWCKIINIYQNFQNLQWHLNSEYQSFLCKYDVTVL